MKITFALTSLFLLLCLRGGAEDALIEDNHLKGQKATTYAERKLELNRALEIDHQLLEKEEIPSVKLDKNIGDIFFQLGEYPWAILYYKKALKDNPDDAVLLSQLELVQKKMGIFDAGQSLNKPAFLERLAEKFDWFLEGSLLIFVILSLSIWFPFCWLRRAAFGLSVLFILFFGNMLFHFYFSPLNGILIQSSGLYRGPDKKQPLATSQPLLEGTEVEILQMTKEGEWLKVKHPNGKIGYLPTQNVRMI